jgi:hypothetical protein
MPNTVAKTIEDLRERGGLSGVDVASVTDVSKATVSWCAAGKAAPQPKTQLLLSDSRYVLDRCRSSARRMRHARRGAPGMRSGAVNVRWI